VSPPVLELTRYRHARVIDAEGTFIGEVTGISGQFVELALGGWRNAWGFIDFTAERHVRVEADTLAFGPPRRLGTTLVMIPTEASLATAVTLMDR